MGEIKETKKIRKIGGSYVEREADQIPYPDYVERAAIRDKAKTNPKELHDEEKVLTRQIQTMKAVIPDSLTQWHKMIAWFI